MSREPMKHIKTLSERCEEHPDHQQGMVSEKIIRARMQEIIDELRQALETEQEPVAFINVEKQKLEWAKLTSWHTPTIVNLPKIPLYTAPPNKEWVSLTDEEIGEVISGQFAERNYWVKITKALESKLKEKNT